MNWNNCLQLPMILAVVLAGSFELRAEEQESDPETIVADLNGDGRPETISRRRLGADQEIGVFFQLVVKDGAGAILWKSPEILDAGDPRAFGEWHFGISMPQIVGDIDRDGKVELVAPAPQSDVSPTFFRVLEWTGSAFVPRHSLALSGAGSKGARFAWSDSPSPSSFWVQRWLGASPEGGWLVELASLPESGKMRVAMAVLTAKDQGFELVRWIKAPEALGGTAHASAPAIAVVAYRARLSAADHVNSSGAALNKIAEILRQDRANYHRGSHRDAEDTADAQYSSPEARATLASLPVTVRGGSEAAGRIIRGTPVVKVTVSGGAVQIEIVEN